MVQLITQKIDTSTRSIRIFSRQLSNDKQTIRFWGFIIYIRMRILAESLNIKQQS